MGWPAKAAVVIASAESALIAIVFIELVWFGWRPRAARVPCNNTVGFSSKVKNFARTGERFFALSFPSFHFFLAVICPLPYAKGHVYVENLLSLFIQEFAG